MAGNTFGHLLCLTSFGESHGPAVGGVLDGFPSGLPIDMEALMTAMERRRPGHGEFQTARNEADLPEFVSGIFQGKTTGAPLAFLIRNNDQRPADYKKMEEFYRPSHAGFAWDAKFGFHDHRGGGRSSARETAVRVAAGALALQLLGKFGISITAYTGQIGNVVSHLSPGDVNPVIVMDSPLRCPDPLAEAEMKILLTGLKAEDDSTGGVVGCVIRGVPAGIGEPVFDRLQADLAKAMMSINAAKGFEYGDGFAAASKKGSEHNDPYEEQEGRLRPASNHAGGILGGISTGEDIFFNVAFKPVSSISKPQLTAGKSGQVQHLSIEGRHDVCIVPRAVPVVEAMAALVIADHMLISGKIPRNIL
ncbi:chorismate synthase [Lentimicrobium saccharophilum]|uniref:Chorismate synthase n=1 Tax=Lentimicrobium saccharophilum TaxID=1678841 RepID=A0A0S7BXL1_9BACT|nr:chorismate synthase [Lentimicrobium saccharophilum]GAP43191.1 chorismate synthase [Lentimicrobium saccharophilum]